MGGLGKSVVILCQQCVVSKGGAHGVRGTSERVCVQQSCQKGAFRTSQKMASTLVNFSAFLTAVTRTPAGSGSPAIKRGVKLRARTLVCASERCGAGASEFANVCAVVGWVEGWSWMG